MLGQRQLTFDDYLAMLRRRLWIILIPAVIGPIVGYGLSLELPRRYASRAKIIIEEPKVPTDFVRPVVHSNVFDRLATMREQILSWTRLQPIIDRYGLYKDLGRKSPSELVIRMRKDIAVKAITTSDSGRTTTVGFTVDYEAPDPKIAQQVCADLTSMFMEENLRLREASAQGTNEFLNKQVQDTKRTLDDLDAQLAEFKTKYLGHIPGEEQMNMNMLITLNSQLDAATGALSRMQQDKSYIESNLAQQLAAWQALRKGGPQPLTLEEQLARMQDELALLEARYTPQHPDIIKLKGDIAQLRKKVEEADAADSPQTQATKAARRKPSEPPAIQQLKHQLEVLDENIQQTTNKQEHLQNQLRVYEGRVQLSPVVEEQYKKLMRDYQTAQGTYDDLLRKKTQSLIATDLETRQEGEQFRLMEPPTLPTKPSYPDPVLFSFGGTGVGLMIGCGIALGFELRDKALRTDHDVEFYLELPALAVLPNIGVQSNNGGKKHFWQRAKPVVADTGHRVGSETAHV